MNARLNWILFAAVLLLIGGNVLLFGGIPRWLTAAPTSAPPSDNEPSCLKVSDFYSVHLTTFFLAAGENGGETKDKTKRYMPYCDRIPGTGQVIFTIDLMEQDARGLGVAISFSKYDSKGQLALLKEVPKGIHPGGVLTLDAPIAERGKYLLKLAFGDAKSKDDTIEMPIMVGQ